MSRTLIIGGTGSLGRKLIERLLPLGDVAVYSRDEAKHWTIRNELQTNSLSDRRGALEFYVGDVRDPRRVTDVIRQYRPETIIVAAALKQVDTCELSPSESVLTNLIGTQNVTDAVNTLPMAHGITVLFVSTDKACAPVNVYGMCKAISERIVTSQARTEPGTARFMAVRYGNVLESRGSIIPLFKYQAEHADFITVTDPDMTRFVMTLSGAVDLIQLALKHGNSGETWIPVLPSMRIGDLAEIFSESSGKPIKIIGLRPGEKLHEDLINESESHRVDRWSSPEYAGVGFVTNFIIKPAYLAGTAKKFTYASSDSVLPKDVLNDHLTKLGILARPLEQFKGLTIEEIITSRKS